MKDMTYELGKSITKLFKAGMFGIPDKSEAEGLLVALRGNKLIKCGAKKKPFGVYTAGSFRKMVLLNGERTEVTIPEGIITYGNTQIKVTEDR